MYDRYSKNQSIRKSYWKKNSKSKYKKGYQHFWTFEKYTVGGLIIKDSTIIFLFWKFEWIFLI